MKYLVVSVILFFCTLQTFGQQEYFVYLQTDNNQAFYVRTGNNVYSSTASGYLILSKLSDSTTAVTVGFAKNVFPEQQFNIPVNHKDAGYLVKNFGDKGWGLFNLQTLAVIMSSNPPGEKKSPEITGNKKNDAFSMLLANAVNDTAVLYTVKRPPKPTPAAPEVAVLEEKKNDTTAAPAIKELPAKDTVALVKILPEKKDSNLVSKSSAKLDSVSSDNAHLPAAKKTISAGNKNKPVADTVAVAKNRPVTTKPPANTTAKNKADAAGKHIDKQKKDTIIISNSPVAKNNSERKDTIIMMNGKPADEKKAVATNSLTQQVKKLLGGRKRDSLQLARNNQVKKEQEKVTVPANKNPPVAVVNTPVKNDTPAVTPLTQSKKDTVAALVKNDQPKPSTNTDTSVVIPAKRARPLVSKAAEFLTDTSYVAIFFDESNEKPDTIRISIPFNEALMLVKQEKPQVKETKAPDSISAGKTSNTNTPPVVALQPAAPPVTKKDTDTADRIKDTGNVATTQQPPVVAPKNENEKANKTVADSAAEIVTKQTTPLVKKDSTAVSKSTKDSVPVIAQQTTPATVKKDTVVTIASEDSAKNVKKSSPPLSLNSDCKEIAFDSDVDKLRIKMLLVTTDEDRIALAKKVYRQKCFSVKQVKALSELFRNDEGKYKWLDAVYPFVSDSANFSSLSELLKDNYYLNRFKAMLRN